MPRLNRIWWCNTSSFASKFKLYDSLLNSILLYGHKTWTLFADSEKKDRGFRNQVPRQTSRTWITRSTTGCRARSVSLWVHRNLFWRLSRDGNMHGTGMSHATTTFPKPSFRTPWKVGDAVGRVNIPVHVRISHKGLLQKRLEEDLC